MKKESVKEGRGNKTYSLQKKQEGISVKRREWLCDKSLKHPSMATMQIGSPPIVPWKNLHALYFQNSIKKHSLFFDKVTSNTCVTMNTKCYDIGKNVMM